MHLHSVRVQHWRGIEELGLDELSHGINLIHGPNEAGKSTILEAVCAGLFDNFNGNGLTEVTPWGSELGSAVVVDFQVGEGRWRVSKVFNHERSCSLEHFEAGRWVAKATGRSAQDRVVQLLGASPARIGQSEPRNWGLGQALWVRQGEATEIDAGQATQDRLKEALEGALNVGEAALIERKVRRDCWDPIFAERGGVRTAARINVLNRQIPEMEREISEFQRKRGELDLAAGHLARCERLRDTKQKARDAAKLRLRCLTAYRESAKEFSDWDQRIRQIEELEKDIRKLEIDVGKLPAEQATKEERTRLEAAIAEAESDVKVIANEAKIASQNSERLTWVVRRLRLESEAKQAQERISEKRKTLADAESARKRLAESTVPNAEQMQRLRTMWQEIERRQMELEIRRKTVSQPVPQTPASSTSRWAMWGAVALAAMGIASLVVAVSGVGGTVTWVLALAFVAAGVMVAVVPRNRRRTNDGLATPSISAQVDSQASATVEELKQQWVAEASRYGAGDLASLEELRNRYRELELQAKHVEESAQSSPALTELEHQQADLLRRIAGLESAVPAGVGWRSILIEDAERDCATAEKEVANQRSLAEQANDALNKANNSLIGFERDNADAERKKLTESIQDKQQQAHRLGQQDGLNDEERRTNRSKASVQLERRKEELNASGGIPADIAVEMAKLERELPTLENEVAAAIEEVGAKQAILEQLQSLGVFSKLTEAEETLGQLRAEYERERRHMESVRLLFDTIRLKRDDALRDIQGPVRGQINHWLGNLDSGRYQLKELSGSLAPTTLSVARQPSASIDALSYGTREQIALLVRLSLAKLLGEALGRQCIILDDPLVNTDDQRQQTCIELMKEVSKVAQVIVFTCHKAAYNGLSGVVKTYELTTTRES